MSLSNEYLKTYVGLDLAIFRKGKEYDDACQPNCDPRQGEALRTGYDLADPVLRHVQKQPIQRA
jgi:hypothetical protein